jgi:outer membrane protein assembly factor BamB
MTAVLLLALTAAGDDWPRFRGPNGSGVAAAVPLGFGPDRVAWTAEVPGRGHASPVVAGGRLFLQSASADGGTRHLLAYDAATGRELWRTDVPGERVRTHAKNSLASSTPAADGGRAFFLVWTGRAVELLGLDAATGREAWRQPLGGYVSQHGFGISPLATDGRVFVNLDQDGAAVLKAFDAETGKPLWAAERKAFRANSAMCLVHKGTVVAASTAGLTAYDPATGAVAWDWGWPFAGMALRTVGSPVLDGDTVVAVAGDGGGSRSAVAVRAGPTPELVWQKTRDVPYVPGPIALGPHLYYLTDAGVATCADIRTGRPVWQERAFPKGVSASPLVAGGAIIAAAEDGKLLAFKATPAGFEVLAEGNFGEPVFASPAAAGGRLFVRGATKLVCYGPK